MAHNYVQELIEELQYELLCGICINDIRAPKALVCMHTFCLKCLASVKQKDAVIACPQCRTNTKIRDGDVKSLPTAFFINRIADILARYLKHNQEAEKSSMQSTQNQVAMSATFSRTGKGSMQYGGNGKSEAGAPSSLRPGKVAGNLETATQAFTANSLSPISREGPVERETYRPLDNTHTAVVQPRLANQVINSSSQKSQGFKFDVYLIKTTPGGGNQLVDNASREYYAN